MKIKACTTMTMALMMIADRGSEPNRAERTDRS